MATATVVFRGVVTDVRRAEPLWRTLGRGAACWLASWVTDEPTRLCVERARGPTHDTDGYVATFRISKVWKGPAQAAVPVRSDEADPDGGSCGLAWRVGDDWVIYAYREKGDTLLSSHACSRSRFGDPAVVESAALDARQNVRRDLVPHMNAP